MKSILGIETAYMGILSIGFLKRVGVLFRELELGPYLLSICIQMKVLESQKQLKVLRRNRFGQESQKTFKQP